MIPIKVIEDYCVGNGWSDKKTETFIAGADWAQRFKYRLTHKDLEFIAERIYKNLVIGNKSFDIFISIDQDRELIVAIDVCGCIIWNDDNTIAKAWIDDYCVYARSSDGDKYHVEFDDREHFYITESLKALSK